MEDFEGNDDKIYLDTFLLCIACGWSLFRCNISLQTFSPGTFSSASANLLRRGSPLAPQGRSDMAIFPGRPIPVHCLFTSDNMCILFFDLIEQTFAVVRLLVWAINAIDVAAEAQKPGWQGGIAIRKVFARPESFCA